MASKVVATSKQSTGSSCAASHNSKVTLPKPAEASRAAAMPLSETSKPTKRLFGYAEPRILNAFPLPHPISATSIPFVSWSLMPKRGTIWSIKVRSNLLPLVSDISAWKRGNLSYGTPPPDSKASTMSASTSANNPICCIGTVRFSGPLLLVSRPACSSGRSNWSVEAL